MGGRRKSVWLQISTYIPRAPAPTDRRVYNFGPVAAADAAAAACALLYYTATPNLINLEIVLARSVSRETWTLGHAKSCMENSKRVISLPYKNDVFQVARSLATGTQLKPRP